MAIRPPWAMFVSIVSQRGRAARHLQADVEALAHAEFVLHVGDGSSRAGRPRR